MSKFRASALILIFHISLASVSAKAGIRVVSDLDDTVKITHIGDPISTVANELFSTRSFVGMRELYVSLEVQRGYGFDYVSGSPSVLKYFSKKFLRNGGFPKGDLHLKSILASESLRAYKARVIRELMTSYPQDRFILVGDDTQVDFDAYDDVFRYAPDRVLAIYIRKVTNHKLPPSAYPFLTAFDFARTEYIMGRLEIDEVTPVALSVLGERRDNRIIPQFSYCPVTDSFFLDGRMDRWSQEIGDRIRKICRARHLLSES